MKRFCLFLAFLLNFNYYAKADDYIYNELVVQVGQTITIDLPAKMLSGSLTNSSGTFLYARLDNAVNSTLTIYGLNRGRSLLVCKANYGGTWYYYCVKVVDTADITLPNNIFLTKGESYTYNPIIQDIGATTTLTWQSTDPQVATVTEDGALKAVSEGKTTIICTAANGVTAQSLVEVKPVKVESVALDESEIELAVGGQKQLVATITPNTANKSVWWSSSNKSVAFVDENGIVTGAAPGYCLISGYAADGIGEKASCLVHVKGDGSGVYKEMGAGDVNSDGSVDVADIATIIRTVAAKGQAAKGGMNE